MRARVSSFRWPDLEDGHGVADPAHACELLEMYVGPQSEPGEERFQLTVCTPSALAERLHHHPVLIGRHWLFVPELRPAEVGRWLSDRIAVLEAATWSELAAKIGRIGEWEFEDWLGGPEE
ncbi:Imm8 family immunity protein [Sphaerimonospora thailandensis]|uniref:Imm8 family immunity protein n=1 Tax=Sphaerimonospora thailandensis TaxID=795644 RepID=UPI001EF2644B|nr:Imm8 family immunity protein [Sphaerimonospora thailandensis]